jgi:hypothetical protein
MHADRKHGNTETRKHGNTETRKHGNTETGTRSFLVRAATAPLWCHPDALVLRGVAYFPLCPFGPF